MPRLKIISVKDESIVHINPGTFMFKLLMRLGVIQETKVLDIEEVDPVAEMNRQIDYLICRGLKPEIILADMKSYDILIKRFDMGKSAGLALPRDMSGVNVQQIYSKKLRLTTKGRQDLGNLFDYVLNHAPFACTVDIRNDQEAQHVDFTWAAYCGIDLIVVPWMEGVTVLPSLYMEERKGHVETRKRIP